MYKVPVKCLLAEMLGFSRWQLLKTVLCWSCASHWLALERINHLNNLFWSPTLDVGSPCELYSISCLVNCRSYCLKMFGLLRASRVKIFMFTAVLVLFYFLKNVMLFLHRSEPESSVSAMSLLWSTANLFVYLEC